MNSVFAIAKKHGRRAQFWADIIMERPDLVSELPSDVIPVIWGYDVNSPYQKQCQIVAEAGFQNQFYVAPGAGNWNSFSGRLEVAEKNIQLAAQQGRAYGAKGLLLTAWGDNGHHQPWLTLYPAVILAAAACHGEILSRTQLADLIDELFFPDESEGNGAAICALGQIDARLPQPLPPCSFLRSAFFATEEKLSKLLKLTETEALAKTAVAIEAIPTANLDPEIDLAKRLSRAAVERCQSQEPSESHENLIEAFARQWKRHSRAGGLTDSLAQIRDSIY